MESFINIGFNLGNGLFLFRSSVGSIALSFGKGSLNTLKRERDMLIFLPSHIYIYIYIYYFKRKFIKRDSFNSIDVERAIGVNSSKTARD